MPTLDEGKQPFDQQLHEFCSILAKKVRLCASDEEASDLLFSSLSEIFKSGLEGWRALIDAKFSSGQER